MTDPRHTPPPDARTVRPGQAVTYHVTEASGRSLPDGGDALNPEVAQGDAIRRSTQLLKDTLEAQERALAEALGLRLGERSMTDMIADVRQARASLHSACGYGQTNGVAPLTHYAMLTIPGLIQAQKQAVRDRDEEIRRLRSRTMAAGRIPPSPIAEGWLSDSIDLKRHQEALAKAIGTELDMGAAIGKVATTRYVLHAALGRDEGAPLEELHILASRVLERIWARERATNTNPDPAIPPLDAAVEALAEGLATLQEQLREMRGQIETVEQATRADSRIGKLCRLTNWDGRIARVVAVEPGGALHTREDGWSSSMSDYRAMPDEVEWVEETPTFPDLAKHPEQGERFIGRLCRMPGEATVWRAIAVEDGMLRLREEGADRPWHICRKLGTMEWFAEGERVEYEQRRVAEADSINAARTCAACGKSAGMTIDVAPEGVPCQWRDWCGSDRCGALLCQPEPARPLRPGDTWRDPEGTEYVVVRAEDVGERPRWWLYGDGRGNPPGFVDKTSLHLRAAGEAAVAALVLRDDGPTREECMRRFDETQHEWGAAPPDPRGNPWGAAAAGAFRAAAEQLRDGQAQPIRSEPGSATAPQWPRGVPTCVRCGCQLFFSSPNGDCICRPCRDLEIVGKEQRSEPDSAVNLILDQLQRAAAEPLPPGAPALRRIYHAADLATIPPGLYELYWRAGGIALAAVGTSRDGRRWFAPVNWVREHVPSVDWGLVDQAVEVRVDGKDGAR